MPSLIWWVRALLLRTVSWTSSMSAKRLLGFSFFDSLGSIFTCFSGSVVSFSLSLYLLFCKSNNVIFAWILRSEMQISVAKSVWSELFTIGLVQCKTMMSLTNVLNVCLMLFEFFIWKFYIRLNSSVLPGFISPPSGELLLLSLSQYCWPCFEVANLYQECTELWSWWHWICCP